MVISRISLDVLAGVFLHYGQGQASCFPLSAVFMLSYAYHVPTSYLY